MKPYIDRCLLLVLSIFLNYQLLFKEKIVVIILIGVIILGITGYIDNLKESYIYLVPYGCIFLLCFIRKEIIPFCALVCFSVVKKYIKELRQLLVMIPPVLLVVGCYWNLCGTYGGILCGILMIISIDLGYKCQELERLGSQIKRNRDDATQLTNALRDRNKYLIENQETEIHVATLSERNRIAREIHDNVGHILSRSILQLGAIMAIHKGEPVNEQLEGLKETLNLAMNNIRESVHDLHKDSFDLKHAAQKVLEELEGRNVQFDYDISQEADKEIKYAFVTILKEAVTNIQKHSNADQIRVFMSELSEHYQMLIEDNGTLGRDRHHSEAGIGIENMENRIRQLKGICTISQENGFRVFISVPKTQEDRK